MKLFRTGAFAKKAGVTVRTLRYYDKVGLLKPAAYSESGQRLYSEADFATLQQILTLKFIGLSLDEIKKLLTSDAVEIQQLLEQQKRVLQKKVKHLSTVIESVEKAQTSQAVDWEQFIHIIRAVNMNTDWFAQFYTDEQRKKLAEIPFAEQKKAGEAWKILFADIATAMETDNPDLQTLVHRWNELMDQFTQGDSDFATNLNHAYVSIGQLPISREIQEWVKGLQDAAIFIQKAGE